MKIRPFSFGAQYADWIRYNCDRCQRGYDYKNRRYKCKLQEALDIAYISDGYIDEEVAKLIGFKEGLYNWNCPQKILKEV